MLLRMRFPFNNPNDPPFVWLKSPRTTPATSFVSRGAVCSTILLILARAVCVEKIVISICSLFQSLEANGRIHDLQVREAEWTEEYVRIRTRQDAPRLEGKVSCCEGPWEAVLLC